MRVWKLKPDGTEELHIYGALGERLGTYPIQLNPNGKYLFYVAAGTTVEYFAGGGSGRLTGWNRNATYYAYGEDYGTPVVNSENFATYLRDATTGLDYAKNRYYSSILGRFMTADPSTSDALADPGQWNKYAYVGNDPVNFNDPQGLDQCSADYGTPWCFTRAVPQQIPLI
jgi:RHS repeat-associated protein